MILNHVKMILLSAAGFISLLHKVVVPTLIAAAKLMSRKYD
jgi:hypothetical protein